MPEQDQPPFLGTWTRVYWAVVLYLAAVIGALVLFTASFRL